MRKLIRVNFCYVYIYIGSGRRVKISEYEIGMEEMQFQGFLLRSPARNGRGGGEGGRWWCYSRVSGPAEQVTTLEGVVISIKLSLYPSWRDRKKNQWLFYYRNFHSRGIYSATIHWFIHPTIDIEELLKYLSTKF